MRRLKTVRRPPIYPKTPGHLPCSSLTHPLPLSSRRPSVSFGGFGFTLSEWFLDSDQGIPYFDGLFAGGSSPELAAQLIAAEVLGVEDVTDVAVVRAVLDPLTRRLSLEFRVSTVHGQVTVAEVL